MKYLVKPFRLLLGIFLFLFSCFLYVFFFVCLFIWHLNPKKAYYQLKKEFRHHWIYFWEDSEWIVKDEIDVYIKHQRKYYKTILDFMNNKITYAK
jgi:hypothetical protein